MRRPFVPFSAVVVVSSFVALAAPWVGAADGTALPEAILVRVQSLQAPRPAGGAALVGPGAAVPRDAKVIGTCETLAHVGAAFRSVTTVDGTTVKLAGRLKASADDRHVRVEIDYEKRTADGVQSIKSNLMLERDKPMIVSGSDNTDIPMLVLTLATPPKLAAASAP